VIRFRDLTCSNGACDGDCSAGKIGINYIGCDYYPTVLPNSSQLDFVNFKYAVAVSNSNSSEATVTVTQNDNVIVTESVSGNSMKIIFLNWTSNSSSTMTSIKQNEAYRLRSTKPVTFISSTRLIIRAEAVIHIQMMPQSLCRQMHGTRNIWLHHVLRSKMVRVIMLLLHLRIIRL
jgi:hypothetical protein